MFVTLPPNELTQLVRSIDVDGAIQEGMEDARWWGVLELASDTPWFFVAVTNPATDENSSILISDFEKFLKLVSGKQRAIKTVVLALPPGSSGTEDWGFETLSSASMGEIKGSREPVWIFQTKSGRTHRVSAQALGDSPVERIRTVFSAT